MARSSPPRTALSLLLLAVLPGVLAGQLPRTPYHWWTNLSQDDAYPAAEIDQSIGMQMNVRQSITAIDGDKIVLNSRTLVMLTGTTRVDTLSAADIRTGQSLSGQSLAALLAGFIDGAPAQPVDADAFRKIEDTICTVGDGLGGNRELICALYEMQVDATTVRVWHAPAVPPIFNGALARAEATTEGRTMSIVMKWYRGKLLEP